MACAPYLEEIRVLQASLDLFEVDVVRDAETEAFMDVVPYAIRHAGSVCDDTVRFESMTIRLRFVPRVVADAVLVDAMKNLQPHGKF